ncbi:MAG: hypothetical protein LBU27_08710 [Candidatus Peribacteria bacterium]|nr:hypothetical protein [Candidatus Peribacteria bacterium]
MHQLLPLFRSEVANRLKGEVPKEIILYGGEVTANKDNAEDATTTLFTKLLKLKQSSPNLFQALITSARKTYQGTVPNATNLMNKLTYGYGLNEIKNLLSKEISVLLYELTTQYKTFDLQCEGTCSFSVDTKLYQWERATISIVPSLQRLEIKGADGTLTNATDISVQAPQDTLITITNYPRTSYAGIPRNTFRGSVTFKKELYQTVEGKVVNDFVVINQLPFMDYLKGVVETNDQESLEKNKVMALIAKNYALFYLEKKNLHPNIPASSSYSAIDSPEMFQKYVGAGAEKTLKKRGQAVETTKNQIVMYAGTLPILPYFSCSAGFTRTAKEKRGRQDTPYLNAAYDFSSCPTFEGHGVGLAGKGAEYLAQKGLTAAEILQRYYSGVVIAQL